MKDKLKKWINILGASSCPGATVRWVDASNEVTGDMSTALKAMGNVKHRIKQSGKMSANFPRITQATVQPVAPGVYLIYISFNERFWFVCEATGEEEGWTELQFDYTDRKAGTALHTEKFSFSLSGGYLFGSMCKSNYHGTWYDFDTYCKILEPFTGGQADEQHD